MPEAVSRKRFFTLDFVFILDIWPSFGVVPPTLRPAGSRGRTMRRGGEPAGHVHRGHGAGSGAYRALGLHWQALSPPRPSRGGSRPAEAYPARRPRAPP